MERCVLWEQTPSSHRCDDSRWYVQASRAGGSAVVTYGPAPKERWRQGSECMSSKLLYN